MAVQGMAGIGSMEPPAMRVVFRADASLQIGTGHVMRCLTLADVLTALGANCHFICREHPGNLIDHIQGKGYRVWALAFSDASDGPSAGAAPLAHAAWLGATQEHDATQCAHILEETSPDWLIVDHYAIDARWELALKPYYHQLMVIDDLADRNHACDLLLDQTYGRLKEDYRPRVTASCKLLVGAQFALLRPEFAALRTYSLQRRATPHLERLLISMGGVDRGNASGQVLEALRDSSLPAGCEIVVVMGPTAPWLKEVEKQARTMPWPTRIAVGVSNMAQLMADSDIAIGAAGSTTWERCCLGLPTAMLVLADNQTYAASLLSRAEAVCMLGLDASLNHELTGFIDKAVNSKQYLKQLSENSSDITDGQGCNRVAESIDPGAKK